MPPFPFPIPSTASVDIFNCSKDTTAVSFQPYTVPSKKSMLFIYCLGGGQGGGGGFTRAAGNPGGGGGGGGSCSPCTVIVPIHLLPSTLFVQVGHGGAGGTAGNNGSQGGTSSVSITTETQATNRLANSPCQGGTSTPGNAAAGGTGGSSGSAPTLSNAVLGGIGLFSGLASHAGTNGGAHTGANGVAQTFPTTGINVMGGTGGAGTTSADFAGGAITGITDSFISDARPIAPAAGSNNGGGGFSLRNYFWHYPGLGGSSSNTGVGGNGGKGGFGCGGGGGGAGTTGGRGGDGGDGLVVMIAW